MQDRRDFFKSIAGLFAVAALDPKALLAPPPKSGAAIAAMSKAATIQHDRQRHDFAKLTRFMHEELIKHLPGGYPDVSSGRQGLSPDFPHQFGIDLDLRFREMQGLSDAAITDRYVLPAMTRMANEIKCLNAAKFAELPLPMGIDAACRVSGNGVSLRGLRAFTIGAGYEDGSGQWIVDEPHWIHRFEVLFVGSKS